MRNGRFVAPDGPQLKHLADALGAVGLRVETLTVERDVMRYGWLFAADKRVCFVPDGDGTPETHPLVVAYNMLTEGIRETLRTVREEYQEPREVQL